MTTPATAEPIAVIGLACRFPGARDADAFWEMLRDGRDGLSRFTEGELAERGVPRELRTHPRFVPVGGLIEGQACFDPVPFGLTDAESALLDPQHRLFLECAWHALEHGGHGNGRGAGAVGVFAGAMQSSYLASNLAGRWDPTGGGPDPLGSLQTAISTQADYLPLQVAYRLDLSGPAVAVATSCSTSLVAVHLAAQSLLAGECDTALAGGVSLIVPQGQGYVHAPEAVFSADGAVRPFSQHGTGIVYTQGVGAVVLRRLDDAIADGDPVLAVLHGSAVNNDGADKAGFTAPSVRGQARVVAEALAVAGISPREVGLVEAHGTATRLGDPIEVAALRQVFGDTGPAWCGLGSVKGNIGHANAAAGIASFIKAVLALHHRVLPASLRARPLNPHLGLPGSPFEVVTETRDWDTPAWAGVSSFGIGGTNCHTVLGPPPERPPTAPDGRPQLLVVSASTPEAAARTAVAVAAAVRGVSDQEADVAHTLATGRARLTHRIAAVSARLAGALPVEAVTPAPRVVWAFPGAGSGYPGMGGELYRDEPVFAAAVDECAAALRPLLGTDVRDVLDPRLDPERMRDVAFGLPALFAVSVGVARLLASWGVRPDALVGHSLGECTAATVGGSLALADAATLVAARCRAAASAAAGAGMLAVALGEEAVVELLPRHGGVDLAAVNAPDACVVSGPAADIGALGEELRGVGVTVTPLPVGAAMHSRMMAAVLPGLREALKDMAGGPPAVPVFSTVTGGRIGAELSDGEHWARQLRGPVRFSEAVRAALGSDGASVLVEVGPGATLAALARRHASPVLRASLPTLVRDEPESVTMREALGALWAHGAPVEPAALLAPGRRRVALPGYAFEHRRLWIDPPETSASSAATSRGVADDPLQLPVWHQVPPLEPAPAPGGRWLVAGADALADALRTELAAVGAEVVSAPMGPGAGAATGDRALTGAVVVAGGGGEEGAKEPVEAVVDALVGMGAVAASLAPGAGAERQGPALLLVTRNGERVGDDPVPDPAHAALRVLPRVLGQELPGLRWATVDLAAAADARLEGRAVLRELGALVAGDAGDETVLRGDSRWRRRFVPWHPAPGGENHGGQDPREPGALSPAATVLITGGLGAVGRLFARHLAERGHRVVVTSRTAERADVALAASGVEVRRCDATDAAATAALVRALASEGSLELVVHAAGVVAGAALDPLRALDLGRVAEHVRVKLGGAAALEAGIAALPEERRPRTVLLMSSVTTLVGGVGMGAYAAANAAADAFADAKSDGTTRWCSARWDGWRVGVDGQPATVVLAGALDGGTGTRALDRLLTARARATLPPVVAVATTDLNPRVAASGMPRTAGGAGGALPRAGVEQAVAELWADLFGAPVTDRDADFFALGGHSLLAVRMLGALRDRFGVALGLRDLLAAPTVGGLAELVDASRPGREPHPSGPARPSPGSEPAAGAVAPEPPLDVDGTFPMTRVQHAYWVGRHGGYRWGEVPCHFYLEYDCPGLDVARYEQAWNQVVARHPMLRAVATPEGRFRVLDDLPRYRIRVHDLTAGSDDRRADRLRGLRQRISTNPAPPDRWPLVQIQAARLPEGTVRVFIGVDVLVCDATSWWTVESELRALYHDPEALLPAVDVHPASCTVALAARRDGPAGERAATYWHSRLGSLPGPPRLPSGEAAVPPRFVRRSARLDGEQWAALRQAAARHHLTPTAVLLTVYTDVLARWSGSYGFCVTLTLFDRPPIHPHVGRVVGDFTSLVLHEVPADPEETFAARASATQARTFADLDHREFSALDVLAERAVRTGEVRPVPVVFTGALGVEDMLEAPGALEWAGEQVHAVSQTPQTWLDHQVLEQGGELRMQWDVLDGVLPADELVAAIADQVARVRELALDPDAWTRRPSRAHRRADGTTAGRGTSRCPRLPEGRDIVLPLRAEPAPGGTARPVLHLVHPSGGDVLCYAELSRAIRPGVDVVALADPELSAGEGPGPETVAGIAAQYVEAIRAAAAPGSGPWLLGGWSMGGSVAQEMSRQLSTAGEHVALLVMLDSNDPARIRAVPGGDGLEVELEVAVRHLHALEAFLGIDLDAGAAARDALAAMAPEARRTAIADRLRRHGLLGRGEDIATRLGVFARHLRALAAHTPLPLTDPGTAALLVRADRRSPRNSGIGMGVDDSPRGEEDLGWGRYLAGPLAVGGADAHHYSLLHPPVLRSVAELVNAALDRALARTYARER